MNKTYDLRSDTVTKPTLEMRLAIKDAKVGDDVFGDDPTVKELEELAAKMLGKEKALFVPSGTMGNQICANILTSPGQEVIAQENHHIFKYEVGALALISSLQTRTLKSYDGCYNIEEVKEAIRGENIHFPKTGLLTMENTHNMAGGMVVPLSHMQEVYSLAKENNINVHLDGARIFHASTYLNKDVKEITKYCDSVMCCLSKGLGSPVGSIIASSEELILKARRVRKMLGGGMRQVGILAAAGLISLNKMTLRLEDDHENTKLLAKGLSQIKGIDLDLSKVHTNIIIFDVSQLGLTSDEFIDKLAKEGILTTTVDRTKVRIIVTYHQTKEDIVDILTKLDTMF